MGKSLMTLYGLSGLRGCGLYTEIKEPLLANCIQMYLILKA